MKDQWIRIMLKDIFTDKINYIIRQMTEANLFFTILCTIVTLSVSQSSLPFPSSAITINLPNNLSQALLKISPDQSMIVIGYSTANLQAYNMVGNFLYTFNSPGLNTSVSINQLDWVPNIGPIALGSQGTLYLWYKNGSFIQSQINNSTNFNKGLSVTSSALGVNYVAVHVNNVVINEYVVSTSGFVFKQAYSPPVSGLNFSDVILYTPGYNALFAWTISSTNNLLFAFSCATGKANTANNYTVSSNYAFSMKQFTSGSSIMLMKNLSIMSITNSVPFSVTYIGPVSSSYSFYYLTTCLPAQYIVTAFGSFTFIYSSNMTKIQTLTTSAPSLDCTSTYLVQNSGGSLYIYDYGDETSGGNGSSTNGSSTNSSSTNSSSTNSSSTNSSSTNSSSGAYIYTSAAALAGWVIGIIVALAVLFVAAIIGCIIYCKKKNNPTQLTLNDTIGQELMITTPSNHHNPQLNHNPHLNGPSGQLSYQTNTAHGTNLNSPEPIIQLETNVNQKF